MEYIMGHQRAVPQLVPCMITESVIKRNVKSMVDHLVNVEDVDVDDVEFENIGNIDDIVEFIRNVDEEQFANIRDEVFEVIDEMEVDFAEIMDKKTWKIMSVWNTNCWSSATRSPLWRSVSFNGEFATKDKRANKSIITKNNGIY
ncbi:hypothetical protein ALC57_12987 [Trachymyrmex cornetzi]|uniref:Uncharacterized protein n=1 Tax=Trachymyrmex cornetzi TaxID=471704 RepID=A0A151J093_9HYME|nr:hypothetical protein ALC57_12987 [Trachymyrmex cornetzi]